jgi:hypothetical protein
MEFRDSFELLTGDKIKEFEEKIGSPLPEAYREFLLKHNGGEPIPSVFHYHIADAVHAKLRLCYAFFGGNAGWYGWT